jgi:hypothetical protein
MLYQPVLFVVPTHPPTFNISLPEVVPIQVFEDI